MTGLTYQGFKANKLDQDCLFFTGALPEQLLPDQIQFENLWSIHPTEFHEIMMHGRLVRTPRWQQAYGRDYHYTKRTNVALPIPSALEPLLHWARRAIDTRLNGLLLNWYDGTLGHYIGKHRDSTTSMVEGAPIVTVSLGEKRVFRLRPWKGTGFVDFEANNGMVFITPYETNLAWTHEVPQSLRFQGRRISVTIRAFR